MKRATPQFLTFAKKEFPHVLRDRKTLLILFGLPIVQIIIFRFALTNEVKNARTLVIDNAKYQISTGIIRKIAASKSFQVVSGHTTNDGIAEAFRDAKVKLAVVFPTDFGADLLRLNHSP